MTPLLIIGCFNIEGNWNKFFDIGDCTSKVKGIGEKRGGRILRERRGRGGSIIWRGSDPRRKWRRVRAV